MISVAVVCGVAKWHVLLIYFDDNDSMCVCMFDYVISSELLLS